MNCLWLMQNTHFIVLPEQRNKETVGYDSNTTVGMTLIRNAALIDRYQSPIIRFRFPEIFDASETIEVETISLNLNN
jgi:hypothetical protein